MTILGTIAEWLGWHKPSSTLIYNPASASEYEARCVRCQRRLLMDSQGNWFTVGDI